MAFAAMHHEKDPADAIRAELGDIAGFDILHNQVLVAVYQRPAKTKSGLILASQTLDEDRYQSKIGLVLKGGPEAFKSSDAWVFPDTIREGSWIVFRPSDGWAVTVNGVLCRMLVDTSVKGVVTHPDLVW